MLTHRLTLVSILLLCVVAIRLDAQPGFLDSSFGNAGLVRTPVLNGGSEAREIVCLADGKILLAGFAIAMPGETKADFAVTRHTANGALDSTFGFDGQVVFDFMDGEDDKANAILVQPDQQIILVGTTYYDGNLGSRSAISVLRLQSNGLALDETFADSGRIVLDFSPYILCNQAAIQPDGKILLVGASIDNSGEARMLVVRLNPDGSLDNSFSQNGWTTIDFPGVLTATARNIHLQPDGKILVAGADELAPGPLLLARLQSTGELDASFSSDGKVVLNYYADGYANDVQMLPNGQILMVGSGYNQNLQTWEVAIVRLNANGLPDNTFGLGGKVVINNPPNKFFGLSMTVQPDGKIISAGLDLTQGLFLVARTLPDGNADAGFGTNGITEIDFGQPAQCTAVTIAPDHGLLLAGYAGTGSQSAFAMAKVQTGLSTSLQNEPMQIHTRLYPNPSQGTMVLDFDLPESGEVTITLLNVYGQKKYTIFDHVWLPVGPTTLPINLPSPFSPGTYFLQLQTKSGSALIQMVTKGK